MKFIIFVAAVVGVSFLFLPESKPVLAVDSDADQSTLSDGQIIKIEETIDQGEIELARLAEKDSKKPEVKAFASAMIRDHSKLNRELKSFAKSEKIESKISLVSSKIEAEALAAKTKLIALPADSFDKNYISGQVDLHQEALDTIDKKLLPSVSNSKLKDLLLKSRKVVAEHLEHARSAKQNLGA